MNNEWTLSEKSAGAGHRAVSLHRGCVLVFIYLHYKDIFVNQPWGAFDRHGKCQKVYTDSIFFRQNFTQKTREFQHTPNCDKTS